MCQSDNWRNVLWFPTAAFMLQCQHINLRLDWVLKISTENKVWRDAPWQILQCPWELLCPFLHTLFKKIRTHLKKKNPKIEMIKYLNSSDQPINEQLHHPGAALSEIMVGWLVNTSLTSASKRHLHGIGYLLLLRHGTEIRKHRCTALRLRHWHLQ